MPMIRYSVCVFILLLILSARLEPAPLPHLRVLTINVWSGLDYTGNIHCGDYENDTRRELRFQILLTQIRRLDPDIIFLQEANPVDTYTTRLADSLSFQEIHLVCNAGIKFGPIGLPTNLKEGIAILARRSLALEVFDVWKLSGSPGIYGDAITIHFDQSIFALVGKITVDGSPIMIVTPHLIAAIPRDSTLMEEFRIHAENTGISQQEYSDAVQLWEKNLRRREEEIEQLIDHLRQIPGNTGVVMAGDLNSEPSSPEITRLMRAVGYIDASPASSSSRGDTWDPVNNENVGFSTRLTDADGDTLDGYGRLSVVYDRRPRRIDYIFLSPHFSPRDITGAGICLDSSVNGLHASDHYGVFADVDLTSYLRRALKLSDTLTLQHESIIEPLPILSYDTDVGLGYGGKVVVRNQLHANESIDLTLFNSTKGERWYRCVFSIPDFELRQGKIYPIALDLIIDYDKWIKNSYFGTGNTSRFSDREFYTKEPLDISITMSRGFSPRFVGQAGIRYKTVRNFNFEDGSTLINREPELNASQVRYASIFGIFRYDTRNSYINPSQGVVVQGEAEWVPHIGMNNVSFTRFSGWFQHYSILFYPKTVLAIRGGVNGLIGENLPVQVLMSVGGNNTLRGSPQDRFLDKTSAVWNAELRFPIYWRFGGVLGLDGGNVWSSLSKIGLTNWAMNPTAGLRFYFDTFIVRIDAGFGKETTGLYFNFGQIF
jgi:endonuclease/exonuclease/phosphatase family metal-dependent hydrolase